MSRHFPEEFEIPLVLSSATIDPAGGGRQPHTLEYTVYPANRRQARFKGRLVFEPKIDLRRYVCKAAIDWIWVELTTDRVTQSGHLHDRLVGVLGREVFVTGPNQEHDAERAYNYTGQSFRVKLQDPRPDEMRLLTATVQDSYRLVGDVRVLGIEIAIDFYPAQTVLDADVDADRHRMVAVLQRHHLADGRFFKGSRDDLRQVYGRPTSKEKTATEFVIPDHIRPLEDSRKLSDTEVKHQTIQERHFALGDQDPLLIDGTVYRGERGSEISYRVQDKVKDGSDPERDENGILPLRKRRARVEVTLLHGGVTRMGIDTLDDLYGFDFVALRNPLFPIYLPTSAGVRGDASEVLQVVDVARLRMVRRAFVRGGCYATMLGERARREWRTTWWRRQRPEDPSFPAKRRERIGKKEHLLEWDAMTRRCSRALGRLTDLWGRAQKP